MVSVLASAVLSDQITALRRGSKDWLARDQANVWGHVYPRNVVPVS